MHNILLILLLYVMVSFAHVELHPHNSALKNIGAKPSLALLKRAGLANPFIFTYTTDIPSEVENCFDYAGNEILAKLIEFRFPIKAKSVICYQSHEVYSESVPYLGARYMDKPCCECAWQREALGYMHQRYHSTCDLVPRCAIRPIQEV